MKVLFTTIEISAAERIGGNDVPPWLSIDEETEIR
jgi:hypothetical protein